MDKFTNICPSCHKHIDLPKNYEREEHHLEITCPLCGKFVCLVCEHVYGNTLKLEVKKTTNKGVKMNSLIFETMEKVIDKKVKLIQTSEYGYLTGYIYRYYHSEEKPTIEYVLIDDATKQTIKIFKEHQISSILIDAPDSVLVYIE